MESPRSTNAGCNEPGDRYRLTPKQFPKRLELELDPRLLDALQEMSVRTGRCLSEIAVELLSKAASDEQMPPPPQGEREGD